MSVNRVSHTESTAPSASQNRSGQQLIQKMLADLNECMLIDRHPLRNKIRRLNPSTVASEASAKSLKEIQARISRSVALAKKRRDCLPTINFPDLPIADKRDDIASAIAAHQVVIIAGETGSGKTTQLPKICLQLGRGVHGLIGHTQPRRLAARTVATRIAEELHTTLGEGVGYQVRFNDQVSDTSHIKLMTDGILLAEIQKDKFLNRYDTIIIDEAHERSLNIDFLLGYLKQLLPKRPDLKLIITSATIDLESFSKHFNDAPIIEVSGRTYAVETIYRPLQDLSEDGELAKGIASAIEELIVNERSGSLSANAGAGDVLVFLSGEGEIRQVALQLRKQNWQDCEILPLYARLSAAEQNKVFSIGRRRGRRIVLATNVAETSVTVPGIRYVVDPGYARISRYSYRTKIQRLPIEPISQASANQRKGRCGRVAEGVCIRLFDEADFNNRPEFTDPEIKRTNLASVILQMLGMRMGEIDQFPFVDPPDHRMIGDGFKLLEELGAVDSKRQLTTIGRNLTKLPVDPRLARMIIAAKQLGCLSEIVIIVSALSIQDPRERPADKQQASDEKHRRFWDRDSDFISFVNLWNYYEQQRQQLSQNHLRKLCKKEFLSVMRMREWRDIHRQLRLACRDLGFKEKDFKPLTFEDRPVEESVDRNSGKHSTDKKSSDKNSSEKNSSDKNRSKRSPNYESIHRALLAGLLSHIAKLDEDREYLGARNRKLRIFPGSGLFKSSAKKSTPKWIVAGEIAETSQVYARICASIAPEWLMGINDELFKRHYSEPHWFQRGGQVMAFERLSLYGLVISERKRVHYGPIDAVLARELFIRGALVEGRLQGNSPSLRAPFFVHNKKVVSELEDMEAKTRRRNILADDQQLFEFYNERIAEEVTTSKHFEKWRKDSERKDAQLLFVDRARLMQQSGDHISEAQFPAQISCDDLNFSLSYRFEPGHVADGLSVTIPIGLLNRIPRHRFEWLVPGLLREKCIALIKMLPKGMRKQMVPVPDYVDRILALVRADNVPLLEVLSRQLLTLAGVKIALDEWNPGQLDDFYRMNYRVVDEDGKMLGQGRDLDKILINFKDHSSDTLHKQTESRFRTENITQWDFGELPREHQFQQAGVTISSYPALVDCKDSVAIVLKDFPEEAQRESERGLVRLYMLQMPQQIKALRKNVLSGNTLNLQLAGIAQHGVKREDWIADFLYAVFYRVFVEGAPLARNEKEFQQRLLAGKGILISQAQTMAQLLEDIVVEYHRVRKMLKAANELAWAFAIADINDQLNMLFLAGFIKDTPYEHLQQYPRYLQAITQRIEKLRGHFQRDKQLSTALKDLSEPLYNQWHVSEGSATRSDILVEFRWMLEEYRVSLFAQRLGTRRPVSEKRLREQWKSVRQSLLTVAS